MLGAVIKQLVKHDVWTTGDIVPSMNTEIPRSDVHGSSLAKEIIQTSIGFSMTDVSKLTDTVHERILLSIVKEIVDDAVPQVMPKGATLSSRTNVAFLNGLFRVIYKMLYDDHALLFKTRHMTKDCMSPSASIGGGGTRGTDLAGVS